MWSILKLHCFFVLHIVGGGTAIFYSGRQRSREGGECRPRLKARVFKRFCRHITSCENDKDCRRGNERCICDEDCGKLCLDPSANCTAGMCQNGGKCEGDVCKCANGYNGTICNQDINECKIPGLDICNKVGGYCKNSFGGYTCQCYGGFSGKNCSVNINECKTNNGTQKCLNGGTCNDGIGRFYCNCTSSFQGQECQYENECVTKKRCNGSHCETHLNGTAICRCNPGVTGKNCDQDIDECASVNGPCNVQHSTCVNTRGSYKCICKAGYTGSRCNDIVDNCASYPCQNKGTCYTEKGIYKCLCVPGYTGPTCAAKVNECASNPCQNGGQCVDRDNSYYCKCEQGFTGTSCETEVDNCASSPCINGTCKTMGFEYYCNCTSGFNGTNCETDIDDCILAQCEHNGTCVDGVNGHSCNCLPGFGGTSCEQDIDECRNSPCKNNGKCNNTLGSYWCICPSGYTGVNCEANVNDCTNSSCLNGGICLDKINNYTCDCHPGFSGHNCGTNIDECLPNPCLFGGNCIDGVADYLCKCPNGRTGKNCKTLIDKCLKNYCKNGATCQSTPDRYICDCAPGYTGQYCEVDIDECHSSPCKNGECHDGVNQYKCICDSGYTGKNCEEDIDYCEKGVCFHNSTCQDGTNTYSCKCAKGFSGRYCEYLDKHCHSNPCRNSATCVNEIGGYSCYCVFGTTGRNCEKEVDWCKSNLCKNGASCTQEKRNFNCACKRDFTGTFCDLKSKGKDCELASKEKNVTNVCQNGAICIDRVSYFSCRCLSGFTGSYCEENINDCASGPCKNGARCIDGVMNYTCKCLPGFTGRNCGTDVNECLSNPCKHGRCFDLINQFYCQCRRGYVGRHCDSNPNDCAKNTCFNGGNCADGIGDFTCNCQPGFKGKRCEEDIDECKSNPCWAKGTEECVNMENDYFCRCKRGFAKRDCAFDIDECLSGPCQHGDCRNEMGGYTCVCPYGFSGRNCEKAVSSCADKPCQNDGSCAQNSTRYGCKCKPGVSGYHCEINPDNCVSSPCLNNGECMDGYNEYTCRCEPGYVGEHCECKSKPCKNGGTHDGDTCRCNCPEGFQGISCEVNAKGANETKCPIQNCSSTFDANANCEKDSGCNIKECDFDSKSCSLDREPWEDCPNDDCWLLFANNRCNEACNSPQCMFDGFDCDKTLPCRNLTACEKSRGNGVCNRLCDTEECGYDPDCGSKKPDFIPGALILWLRIEKSAFIEMKNDFLMQMSIILRTVVLIKVNEDDQELIESVSVARKKRSIINLRRFKRSSETTGEGTKVALKIDNRKCSKNCFTSTNQVANYLAALKTQGRSLPGSPFKIDTEEPEKPTGEPVFSPLWIAVLCVLVPLIFVGVLVGGKRVFAKLWLPEGFPSRPVRRRSQRHDPVGEDAADKDSIGKSTASGSSIDEDFEEQPNSGARPPKRFKLVERDGPIRIANPKDPRQWTALHREVTDVNNRTLSRLSVLTPPQEGQESNAAQSDVNAVGPGGLTPLMLAVSRGNYLDGTVEDDKENDDSGGQVVSELIQFGARIDSRSENLKETALHLAARHARADGAKRLLDAGADANARDRTGRTPLHLAVTADAQGVFQILLRHRATELDAQSDDGTTPLIYAARFMVDDIVEELIKAGAKVNLTDKQGKTALHWTASVNNEKATALLLKNNAKKDAQDSKGQTPLFLASKEGSASVVKMLLSSFANRKLADNMDQSPLEIARQREHADIVKLLSDWSLGCKSPTAAPAATSPDGEMSPLASRTLSPPDVRPKTNGSPRGPGENLQRQTKKKRRKSRTENDGQNVAMLTSASPPNPPPRHGTSPRQGLSPFSNHSYGSSLSPSNSTFSPPRQSVDGIPSPLRDSDPSHGGIPEVEFYTMSEGLGNYGNPTNYETSAPDFNMIERSLNLNDLALFLGPSHEERAKDCMYESQYPPVNMTLPNGVVNDVRMHYGVDKRSQGGAAKTCVRSPSELTAWNTLCSNTAAITQTMPSVNVESGYHRGTRNRGDCLYPSPPYELSPTSPEIQWSSSSSRSSNSDCSTC